MPAWLTSTRASHASSPRVTPSTHISRKNIVKNGIDGKMRPVSVLRMLLVLSALVAAVAGASRAPGATALFVAGEFTAYPFVDGPLLRNFAVFDMAKGQFRRDDGPQLDGRAFAVAPSLGHSPHAQTRGRVPDGGAWVGGAFSNPEKEGYGLIAHYNKTVRRWRGGRDGEGERERGRERERERERERGLQSRGGSENSRSPHSPLAGHHNGQADCGIGGKKAEN